MNCSEIVSRRNSFSLSEFEQRLATSLFAAFDFYPSFQKSTQRVLDIGCNEFLNSRVLFPFLDRSVSLLGIEISQGRNRARTNLASAATSARNSAASVQRIGLVQSDVLTCRGLLRGEGAYAPLSSSDLALIQHPDPCVRYSHNVEDAIRNPVFLWKMFVMFRKLGIPMIVTVYRDDEFACLCSLLEFGGYKSVRKVRNPESFDLREYDVGKVSEYYLRMRDRQIACDWSQTEQRHSRSGQMRNEWLPTLEEEYLEAVLSERMNHANQRVNKHVIIAMPTGEIGLLDLAKYAASSCDLKVIMPMAWGKNAAAICASLCREFLSSL